MLLCIGSTGSALYAVMHKSTMQCQGIVGSENRDRIDSFFTATEQHGFCAFSGKNTP
jgi:hypothetical protein